MANAATTYRELQDRTLELLSKSDSVTRNRVKNWLNLGYYDFILREQWPSREVTDSVTTVAGTQEYTLTSEFADIDQNNIVSVAVQSPINRKLVYWPYTQLRSSQPDFTIIGNAVPERYYLKDGKIGLWPCPDSAYTILVDYFKLPTEMSNDSDTPSLIPTPYRESLIHYSLSLEHDFNTDPDLAQKAMNRYEQIVTLARNNLLSQPFDTGNFTILGPSSFINHTGLSGEVR